MFDNQAGIHVRKKKKKKKGISGSILQFFEKCQWEQAVIYKGYFHRINVKLNKTWMAQKTNEVRRLGVQQYVKNTSYDS